MEAARQFGFAARFVTGYLYDPAEDGGGGDDALAGGGASHAWAETFVPGAGWIECDPTNSIVAGGNLIRVATTRTPAQAQPVRGTFKGDGAACLGMDVTVTVRESA
jgi:transglutaminase-like putative cysteine protease